MTKSKRKSKSRREEVEVKLNCSVECEVGLKNRDWYATFKREQGALDKEEARAKDSRVMLSFHPLTPSDLHVIDDLNQ